MDLAKYKVWITNGAAYYPVRKSASSSLQHAFGGKAVDMRLVPQGILKFTMVRNPFDRLASLYAKELAYPPLQYSGIHPGMSFEDFILKVSTTIEPLCDHHLWGANHNVPQDAEVFYFEDFENEIIRMRTFLGRDFPIRHFGKTKPVKPEYTPRLEQLVACRYRKDLERFYENNTTQQDCRARGKAKARIQQGSLGRTTGLDKV